MNNENNKDNKPESNQGILTEVEGNSEVKNQTIISENIQEMVSGLVTRMSPTPIDKLSPEATEKMFYSAIELEKIKVQNKHDLRKTFLKYVFWIIIEGFILLAIVAGICAIMNKDEMFRLLIVGISCFFGGTFVKKFWKEE